MDMAYVAGVRTMPTLHALAFPGLLEYSISLPPPSSAWAHVAHDGCGEQAWERSAMSVVH